MELTIKVRSSDKLTVTDSTTKLSTLRLCGKKALTVNTPSPTSAPLGQNKPLPATSTMLVKSSVGLSVVPARQPQVPHSCCKTAKKSTSAALAAQTAKPPALTNSVKWSASPRMGIFKTAPLSGTTAPLKT